MSKVKQLDLFTLHDPDPQQVAPILNGMYFERETGLFVTYVQGRRHFEVTPGKCLGDKSWKETTKRERAI